MDNIAQEQAITKPELPINSKQIDWEQDEDKVILAIYEWLS